MTDILKSKLGVFQGRYTYDEIKIGSKTGESLMAFDDQTLEFVVVKRLNPSEPNPDLREASIADLVREEQALRTASIANHPVTCSLITAGQAQEKGWTYRYLVLERARGTHVPELIQNFHDRGQAFPERVYLQIMRQLLDLLASAHLAGIVYNDVKAAHLFWDEKKELLKVIDWGNAQFGAEKDAIMPAADVFQCGELLYEFVTGDTYTPGALGNREKAAGRPRWQAPISQLVEPGLRRLVSKALHPDIKQRYADAAAMAADLDGYQRNREQRFLEEFSSTLDSSPVAAAEQTQLAPKAATRKVRRARTQSRRRWRRVAVPLALTVVVIGVVFSGLFNPGQRESAQSVAVVPPAFVASSTPELILAVVAPTRVAVATPVSTLQPASPAPSLVATRDTVQETCEAIMNAEAQQQWSTVIEQVIAIQSVADTSTMACEDRMLAQIEAQAYYELGREAYDNGGFSIAQEFWATAAGLSLAPEAPIDLLIGCATAQEHGEAALFEDLITLFGVETIQTQCSFNPSDYLPTPTSSFLEIDLLSSMANNQESLFAACGRTPCPGLYQDQSLSWHFNTFFDNSEAYLPLDTQFQIESTGQEWQDNLRGVNFELSIASVQPNSFPSSREIKLTSRSQVSYVGCVICSCSSPIKARHVCSGLIFVASPSYRMTPLRLEPPTRSRSSALRPMPK